MQLSTNSQLRRNTRRRIERVLDIEPTLRIEKLENNGVRINEYIITLLHGLWYVSGTDFSFCRRKSALGYVICLINNNPNLARRIDTLDNKLYALSDNISRYGHLMRVTADNEKRDVFKSRISRDVADLIINDSQLTTILKSLSL